MSDTKDTAPQGTKILGAVAAIVALAALLFWGTNQGQTPEAEVISGGEKPSQSAYQSEAETLDYESARLGEYETGAKVTFDAKVVKVVSDTDLGEQNALVNYVTEQATDVESVKQEQVLLVFTGNSDIAQNADVTVQARYLGAGTFESAIGGEKEVPAFQVDYLESTS